MDTEFYIKYGLLSLLFIFGGIGTRIYLRKTGLNDMKRILGMNVYWIKLYSIFAIIMGSLAMVAILITLYFELEYLDII